MSETSHRLIDERAAFRCKTLQKRNLARTLTKAVQISLHVGFRRRAERAAEEIGAYLEPAAGNPDLQGAYTVLKGANATRP